MSIIASEFVERIPPEKRQLTIGGLAIVLAFLVWMLWPSGKPPEFCPGATYRAGQLVQAFDQRTFQPVDRVVGKDCKLQSADVDEINAARERTLKWTSWDQAHSPQAEADPVKSSLLYKTIAPFAAFFGFVLAAWLLLFAIFMLFMLIGFLIVSVVGLRFMPMIVLLSPVMFWWKVLIEFPSGLCSQFINVIHKKEQVSGLRRVAFGYFKEFLGLAKFERPPLGNLGSARFGTLEEVASLDRHKGAPLALGYVNGAPLKFHTEKHVFMLAGTREGKGRDLIIPNLLRYQGSTLVLDVKGENYRSTAAQRARLGPVRYLDPWNMTEGSSIGERMNFNPLRLISESNKDAVDNADVLAHSLIMSMGSEPHWSLAGRGLTRGTILHVASAPEFEGQRDLITVRHLLMSNLMPSRGSKDEKSSEEGDTEYVRAQGKSTLERMAENEAFDGVIADFALSLMATPSKEAGSIISNAQRQTDFLDTPAMRAALRDTGEQEQIDFSEWRQRVMSCFICIPADKLEGSGQRWVRLVVATALNEMLREVTPPALPVQFMLDEIAALDRLEQVERAVGLAAGHGVQLWTVWQDIAQMKELYKARWSSFVGNAGARYVFGISEVESARYFSDMLGLTTETTVSQSIDPLGLSVTGQGRSVQTRPLLTHDEIMAMPPDKMLVLFSGVRPILAHRVPWFEDPSLKVLAP